MTTTTPLPLSDEAIADLKGISNYPHGFEPPDEDLLGLLATIDHWKARAEQAEAALREIAKGEGEFSRDPLTHAGNCIESMKAIAAEALKARASSDTAPIPMLTAEK